MCVMHAPMQMVQMDAAVTSVDRLRSGWVYSVELAGSRTVGCAGEQGELGMRLPFVVGAWCYVFHIQHNS